MKKTFKALSVLAVVICCALAFAVNRQGSLPKVISLGNSDKAKASIEMAKARIQPGLRTGVRAKSDSVSNPVTGNEQSVVVELFNADSNIIRSQNIEVDAANHMVQFTISEYYNALWSAIDAGGNYYAWMSVPEVEYEFRGHIAANDSAVVYPCIFIANDEGLFSVYSNTVVSLDADNGYSADFSLFSTFSQVNEILGLGFIVSEESEATEFTATDVHFTYTMSGLIGQKWTPENDMEGLGIEEYMADNAYIVKCNDGISTLGVYNNYGNVYITGINTTATELTMPESIVLDGNFITPRYFGYDEVNWNGAPALTSLDFGTINIVNANFQESALTDIYVHSNCEFYNTTGFENIYLHIPYNISRDDFAYFGFKRILVGMETPEFPVGDISRWVIPGDEEGVYFGIGLYNGYFRIAEIFTDKESVTLPIGTPYMDGLYYIRGFGFENDYSSRYLCQHAPNLKSVTIPDNYYEMHVNWSNQPITELHMQGNVPSTDWTLPDSMTVYVAEQAYYSNFENDRAWNNANLLPEGWDFEWMTIDVKRKGEFAQTYIEMTDADWSLGMYVKVTGPLSETDLGNIKNLTNLRKLDLSEAAFDVLPASFLSNASSLNEVSLPENVKTIPNYAFNNCNKLAKVNASGIETVGNYAFNNCYMLNDFDISNVKEIGNYGFYYCNVFNPAAFCSELRKIGNNAFYNSGVTEVVLPETMTTLENSVFSYCNKLIKVTLPSSIVNIDSYAFSACRNLVEVNMEEGITSIGYNAFYNCENLTELTLPSTLQLICDNALGYCSSLHTVKCKAIVPPVATSQFTYGMDLNHTTLYIAPFAIDAYREAANWSAFYIMKALNEPVKNIYINRAMTFDLLSEDNAVLQENPNMTLDYGDGQVGQLSATGDGTLSAGVFKIFHRFERRDNNYYDYRTTLVNDAQNMRADSVMCSIQFSKNNWHFISFQYDVKMEDIFGLNGTDFVIRQYNAERRAQGESTGSNWEDVPADGTLVAGKGYIIQAANNASDESNRTYQAIVRFPSRNTTTKNNLFTNNNVIVPLDEYPAEFAHNRSWNLVGNPYPCYYDMHALMNDFTTPVTLWRGASYQAYSPVDDDIILRPNEAFFVQRPLDAENMTFGVEGRMHYTAAYNANNNATPGTSYAPALTAQGASRSVFNFTVEGCGSNDRARIVMNEEASMNYEIERDASKFFAENATGAELYVDGDVQYSICERPLENGEALLGLRVAQQGEYTISLAGRNTEGWSVILTDNLTGVTVDVTQTPYAFQSEAGCFDGRFTVKFQAPGQSGVENLTDREISDVQVVNAAGIVVFNGNFNDFKASAQPGVYVVVSKEKTVKIVVK